MRHARLPNWQTCQIVKKHILHILAAFILVAAPAAHAGSSIFDDPVPKYEGHGPTKLVPLWPLYYYKIYTSKASSRKHILWPIFTRTVTPQYTVNQILSFQNKYPISFTKHTYFLWPLSGFQSDPSFGYNDWIFPILWQSNVKGATRQNVVFPLYWYCKPPDGDTQILNIALLNHNYWGPGYHNHLLLPIAWTKWGKKRDFDGYSHLLFPLFYANREMQLAEGKNGATMHTLRERAFITLFYRWYHDKNAPEGLAQVNNLGLFPISFYKKENYLYYANGNVIRNKIFFLFPSLASVRFKVVRPDRVPEDFQQLDEDPGSTLLQRDMDLYFPLYFRFYGYEITDAPQDLKGVKQIPTEYDFRWIFPYYYSYHRSPVQSLSHQEIPIADEDVREIFMPSRIQDNLDTYIKRTSGFPLLYHNTRKTWKEGNSSKVLVDQHSIYLFPYFTRYAKNKNSEGRQSIFMLLGGWGNADLKIPDLPGYSQKYFYLFPFYAKSYRHSIGAIPNSLDDRENSLFWLFPYYRSTKRIGKSIGRTDSVFPFAYKSDEENTKSNWWYGLLAGQFERQIPLQSKFDANKYPVTIYEDEDPRDFTRRIFFFLPFWYSKNNLNSAYWMLFPFYGVSHSNPQDETASKATTIPIALARFKTSENADGSVEKRGFAGAGLYYKSSYSTPGSNDKPQSTYWHAIPFYARTEKPNSSRITASIPPVSIDHATIQTDGGQVIEKRTIASPHRWLPIFKSTSQKTNHKDGEPDTTLSSHWLFPFYSMYDSKSYDNSPGSLDKGDMPQHVEKQSSKTTIGGGLLYYSSQENGLRNQIILSGIVSTRQYDPLYFESKSAFFGLYGKRHHSWGTQSRLFPFYSKTQNEDQTSDLKILGGMFGSKETRDGHINRIFFFPHVTRKESQSKLPTDETLAEMNKNKTQHLRLAEQYAERHFPEYAAVEFLLADGEYDEDARLLRLAADQFAKLDPDKLEKLLKNVPPQLLARTPSFSSETYLAFFPDAVYSKAAELYNQVLTIIGTDFTTAGEGDSQEQEHLENKTDFNSTALALALLYYKYEKFDQCFNILRQRYDKTEEKRDGVDLLHFYMDYVTHHQRRSRTKPHIAFTKELREKFPGDPIIEFFHALQELSPISDAYLDDMAIPLFLEILELNGENIIAEQERDQVLSLPPWPVPFLHVSPNGFPTFSDVLRATHNELALCYQRKLQQLRTDVFGLIKSSSIYVPKIMHIKELQRRQREMTPEKRKMVTAEYINQIMLHLSQGTDFAPFKKTFESLPLYPCKRIQSQVLQALKKDYETDLKVNHYEPRRAQLVELNKILWKTSYDISFLRNWDVTLVQGIPTEKGNGPFAVEATPEGFVDIDYAFNGIDNCTVEATTHFHNYFPRKLTLFLGFDHTLTVELNGQHVFGPKSKHIARRDQESVVLDIPEGDINMKFIIKDDILNYGFFARFTDEKGMPFFFNDLHQLNCKACGDQIEYWVQAITPQLKVQDGDAQ